MSDFKREVVFIPAFDKAKEGYGVHCVDMVFYLHGPKGVVQFRVFTGWHLPQVYKRLKDFHGTRGIDRPMAADLGYHSPKPRFEGQTLMEEECHLLKGPCYYDGSTLNAEPILETLIAEGSEAVWQQLEIFYDDTFNQETPDA